VVVDISVNHTAEILNLPLHLRDPLDRLLFGHARVEQIAIISVDCVFDAHGVILFGKHWLVYPAGMLCAASAHQRGQGKARLARRICPGISRRKRICRFDA
jgi:hypothetical protein